MDDSHCDDHHGVKCSCSWDCSIFDGYRNYLIGRLWDDSAGVENMMLKRISFGTIQLAMVSVIHMRGSLWNVSASDDIAMLKISQSWDDSIRDGSRDS